MKSDIWYEAEKKKSVGRFLFSTTSWDAWHIWTMCRKVYIPKKRGKKFFLTQKIPGIRGNNYTELKNREYNVNIKCERTPNQLPDHTYFRTTEYSWEVILWSSHKVFSLGEILQLTYCTLVRVSLNLERYKPSFCLCLSFLMMLGILLLLNKCQVMML